MRKVVITGMGVVSPIGNNIPDFTKALVEGRSGIGFIPELESHGFACKIGGLPDPLGAHTRWFEAYGLNVNSETINYSLTAGLEAWLDAGLPEPDAEIQYQDIGCAVGTAFAGVDVFCNKIFPMTRSGEVRKLGGYTVENWMPSGPAVFLSALFGLQNLALCNSSACSTGTEALVLARQRICDGHACIMLAGGVDIYSPYAWAGFDSMRILTRKFNEAPTLGSRPMSASASGFVPGAGAGILVLEELEHAKKRGARIYAELSGGHINSGGQRNGGTMTAPNPGQGIRCITEALQSSGIPADEIDLISGHLTSTIADPTEISSWVSALNRKDDRFPMINSLKSMTGHMIGAAGAVESIAAILQMNHQFVHPSLNCQDTHPKISALIDPNCIPQNTLLDVRIRNVIKLSLGFGDVNSCIVFSNND